MALPGLQSYTFLVQAGVKHSAFARYFEQPSSQASAEMQTSVQVAATTNFQAVNLATLFPALTNGQVLIVQEITGVPTGFNVSGDNGNVGFAVRPGSIFAVGINALPTFYLSNPSATPIQLLITVLGS